MKRTNFILFGILSIISFFSFSQQNLYYADYIYEPGIQTVLFSKNGALYSYPTLQLNNTENNLLLTFDDLSTERKEFQFTIIHCESDWQPSKLMSSEYLQGTSFESIINIEPSFNTYKKYTHYWCTVPGEYVKPKISGNYLLKVYYAGEEDRVIITRRFYVLDSKIQIKASVVPPNFVQYRNTHQEVDFEVDYAGLSIRNPVQDIKVVIRQNQRWDNQITGLKPKFINNTKLIYNYTEENLFPGGSEFRYVDLRDNKVAGRGVSKITLDSLYNFKLYSDEDRSKKSYISTPDLNGERLICGSDLSIPSNEIEYVTVNFCLLSAFPEEKGDVFLFGALTDWRLQEDYRMQYNISKNCYEKSVLLKQGFYNYEYVVADKTIHTIDATHFEGNHFETENNYLILVYQHTTFIDTDELLGLYTLNSSSK